MFLFISFFSSLWANECDVASLSKTVKTATGDDVAQAFVELSECAPSEAQKLAPSAVPKFFSGSLANSAIVAATKIKAYKPVQKWLQDQLPPDRTSALRALGKQCKESVEIQNFFIMQSKENAESFWSDRWYKPLGGCRVSPSLKC